MSLERGLAQPNKTDKLCGLSQFDSPEPKAFAFKVLLDVLHHFSAFLGVQASGEKLHHLCVCIHCGEGFNIARSPLSQQ
jgi:hypothetical protein